MAIRTYYWDERNVSIYKYYKYKITKPNHIFFKYGNMGDIFNKDLIKYIYNDIAVNCINQESRLLLVGSIASKMMKGDIINGIGWKGNDLAEKKELIRTLKIYGVRGPLSRQLFEKYGADLSNLKFEYDPGLLIKEVYKINLKNSEEKNIIFIPHFNDAQIYKNKYPKNIKIVNVDNSPLNIAKEILKAKVVYTSSLHGLIFSHALNKPCVFVKPQSKEAMFKYHDYFLSIGVDFPVPLKDIHSKNFLLDKPSVLSKNIGVRDFYFPNITELINAKIIT